MTSGRWLQIGKDETYFVWKEVIEPAVVGLAFGSGVEKRGVRGGLGG